MLKSLQPLPAPARAKTICWLPHSLKLISNGTHVKWYLYWYYAPQTETVVCLPSVACSQVCIHSIDEATDMSAGL